MLPMPGKELLDDFFLEVFLKRDRILNELSIDVLHGDVFLFFLDQLRFFSFGLVCECRNDSLVVVFFLSLVIFFEKGFVDFESGISTGDSAVLAFGRVNSGLRDHFIHLWIDKLIILKIIKYRLIELIFLHNWVVIYVVVRHQLIQLFSVLLDRLFDLVGLFIVLILNGYPFIVVHLLKLLSISLHLLDNLFTDVCMFKLLILNCPLLLSVK